jgi:uncharacterized protein (TIGR02246 family)
VRKTTRLLLVTAVLPFLIAAGPAAESGSHKQHNTSARLKAEVAAAVLAWTTAFNSGDYEKAASMFTRDMIGWYPNWEDSFDKEQDAIQENRETDRKGIKIRYTARIKDILLAGDRDAVVMSVWTKDTQQPDGTRESHDVRYISAWRREKDGVWRVARYFGSRVPDAGSADSDGKRTGLSLKAAESAP